MSHEARVRRFYSHGAENYGTFHENYLNFGYWPPGVTDYVTAAEALLARLGSTIGLSGDSEVLDVACGMGTQDRFLVSRFGCRSIEALDLTPKHIEIARARCVTPAITFRIGDACRLTFSDATFTHVMAIEGIVHFDTRDTFFRQARRVLMPGGRLGIADFFLPRTPRTWIERSILASTVRAWHVPRGNVLTAAAYRAALERAGFTDIQIEEVTDQVIPGYLAEQRRPDTRRAQIAIRGPIIGRCGAVIDVLVERAYRRGLLGYLLASATRPDIGGRHADQSCP
jgi:SAM-dependent methyltransferase